MIKAIAMVYGAFFSILALSALIIFVSAALLGCTHLREHDSRVSVGVKVPVQDASKVTLETGLSYKL